MRRSEADFASPIAREAALRLGRAVRRARIGGQLTQADFADRARIGRRTLIRIEIGDPSVSFTGWLSALECAGLLGLLELPPAEPALPVFEEDPEVLEARRRKGKAKRPPRGRYDF